MRWMKMSAWSRRCSSHPRTTLSLIPLYHHHLRHILGCSLGGRVFRMSQAHLISPKQSSPLQTRRTSRRPTPSSSHRCRLHRLLPRRSSRTRAAPRPTPLSSQPSASTPITLLRPRLTRHTCLRPHQLHSATSRAPVHLLAAPSPSLCGPRTTVPPYISHSPHRQPHNSSTIPPNTSTKKVTTMHPPPGAFPSWEALAVHYYLIAPHAPCCHPHRLGGISQCGR